MWSTWICFPPFLRTVSLQGSFTSELGVCCGEVLEKWCIWIPAGCWGPSQARPHQGLRCPLDQLHLLPVGLHLGAWRARTVWGACVSWMSFSMKHLENHYTSPWEINISQNLVNLLCTYIVIYIHHPASIFWVPSRLLLRCGRALCHVPHSFPERCWVVGKTSVDGLCVLTPKCLSCTWLAFRGMASIPIVYPAVSSWAISKKYLHIRF